MSIVEIENSILSGEVTAPPSNQPHTGLWYAHSSQGAEQ